MLLDAVKRIEDIPHKSRSHYVGDPAHDGVAEGFLDLTGRGRVIRLQDPQAMRHRTGRQTASLSNLSGQRLDDARAENVSGRDASEAVRHPAPTTSYATKEHVTVSHWSHSLRS